MGFHFLFIFILGKDASQIKQANLPRTPRGDLFMSPPLLSESSSLSPFFKGWSIFLNPRGLLEFHAGFLQYNYERFYLNVNKNFKQHSRQLTFPSS